MGKTTSVQSTHPDSVELAAESLRHGRLVAMPTETVYGLAGWVRDPEAIEGIFEMKGRPAKDPLIVHIFDSSWISRFAELTFAQEHVVNLLAGRFWPGPLTFVLPSREDVLEAIRAGGPSVALRSPANDFFRNVLRALGDGIAAPSANMFGHISPTSAQDVLEEFNGRDLLVVDGGACHVGIESTILEVDAFGRLRVLRPGVVTRASIMSALESCNLSPEWIPEGHQEPVVPGQEIRHYSPNKECYALAILEQSLHGGTAENLFCLEEAVLIDYGSSLSQRFPQSVKKFKQYFNPTSSDDLEGFTQELFHSFRRAEKVEEAKAIAIYFPDEKDEGWSDAIRNRITRASSGRRIYWNGSSQYLFK